MCRSAIEFPPNGRRCEKGNHLTPEEEQAKKDARNARRRELYKIRMAQRDGHIPTALPVKHHPLMESRYEDLATDIEWGDEDDNPLAALDAPAISVSEIPEYDAELGVTFYKQEGELVNQEYFASRRATGYLDPDKINKDTWKKFGFPDPNDPSTNGRQEYMTRLTDVLSQLETQNISLEDQRLVDYYTSEEYEWVNKSLYSGAYANQNPEDDLFKQETAELESHDWGANEHWDEFTQNAPGLHMYTKKLNNFLNNTTPGISRIVHRGVNIRSLLRQIDPTATISGAVTDEDREKVNGWLDQIEPGKDLHFPGFLSTSVDPIQAIGYSVQGVRFQIYTPQGVQISTWSSYPEEEEVILPTDGTYRTVGVHTVGDSGRRIIQLVAVDKQGNILDGTNSPTPVEVCQNKMMKETS